MCGRYALYSKKLVKKKYNISLNKNYNICPFSKVLILRRELNAEMLYWGINKQYNSKEFKLINARIESIEVKSLYIKSERCIFIADGYYEWSKHNNKKKPYYFYLKSSLLYLGGLIIDDKALIITMPSNSETSFIHHRQPLVINERNISDWIQGDTKLDMYKASNLNYHQVSNKVNNPLNNFESLIKISNI